MFLEYGRVFYRKTSQVPRKKNALETHQMQGKIELVRADLTPYVLKGGECVYVKTLHNREIARAHPVQT